MIAERNVKIVAEGWSGGPKNIYVYKWHQKMVKALKCGDPRGWQRSKLEKVHQAREACLPPSERSD